MGRMEILEGANMTNWLQLTLKASVSDSPEMKAVLAAHNRIVELERKLAASDALTTPMPWEGGDPHWRAQVGNLVAVVVTIDQEDITENYMCWVALSDDENMPLAGAGPVQLYTLSGAQVWCADRIHGLVENGANGADTQASH